MSQAYIVCPRTDKHVYVGLNLEWLGLDTLTIGEQRIVCPACGETHIWRKEDLVLRADGSGG